MLRKLLGEAIEACFIALNAGAFVAQEGDHQDIVVFVVGQAMKFPIGTLKVLPVGRVTANVSGVGRRETGRNTDHHQ